MRVGKKSQSRRGGGKERRGSVGAWGPHLEDQTSDVTELRQTKKEGGRLPPRKWEFCRHEFVIQLGEKKWP